MATTAQSEDINSFTVIEDVMCEVCEAKENIYVCDGARFLCLQHLKEENESRR